MTHVKSLAAVSCFALLLALSAQAYGQRDPGPRAGDPGAGAPFGNLDSNERDHFDDGLADFMEVDSVSGQIAGEGSVGLGPTFNGNSCAQCHAQPAVGGSSPKVNPQVGLATLDGATNVVPSFIRIDGPVREARFIRNPDGTPDGGVHGLYTIKGRTDAPGCNLSQPDFATQLGRGNVSFRIPTPTFGLGLVEATADSALQNNLAANRSIKTALGIKGRFNTSGNDGSITRFGWKAQNKSLAIFAAEAYNVEQGVSNEGFPNERSAVAGCVFNLSPEDGTRETAENGGNTGTAGDMSSDMVNFSVFMRFLAPPTPATLTASAKNGSTVFTNVGCALCHSSTLATSKTRSPSMSEVTYHPYSDFAIHHMGSGLSDGISQGAAGPDEFRTAPLWGLGQRIFFLHDGRTSDLSKAIQAHGSRGSEANTVINRYNSLTRTQTQDLLNFLRSL
jgi:CxxC motif-containing protein (DUF1111 family)